MSTLAKTLLLVFFMTMSYCLVQQNASAVSVPAGENILRLNADFEKGELFPWEFLGGGKAEIVQDDVKQGKYACKMSERYEGYWSPAYNIMGLVENGEYKVSFWLKPLDADVKTLRACLLVTYEDGTENYITLLSREKMSGNSWELVDGIATVKINPGKIKSVKFYLFMEPVTLSYIIDDVRIIRVGVQHE